MTIDKGELTMGKQIINPNPLKRGNNRVMEIDPNLVETGCRYNVICEYIYCIDASDLFQMIPPPGGSKTPSDIQHTQTSLLDKHTTPLFSLQPNPAQHIVNIIGKTEDIQSICLLNMNGKTLNTYTGTTLNIENIKAGSYLVRIVTKGNIFQYLKLIKE